MRDTLVVARWDEDTSWTAGVPDNWAVETVQKDVDLPNRGREPSSFLWWILANYRRLRTTGVYGFVQGDPFPHAADLVARLGQPVDGFAPLSNHEPFRCDGMGRPHHEGVPVAECHERWLGRPCPPEVTFWPGGQFAVTGQVLRRRPVGFYRRVYDDLMGRDGQQPWAAERLWPLMFDREG